MDMSLSKLQERVEGQGSLACCSPWGRKESDMTVWLNNNKYHNETLKCYLSIAYQELHNNEVYYMSTSGMKVKEKERNNKNKSLKADKHKSSM